MTHHETTFRVVIILKQTLFIEYHRHACKTLVEKREVKGSEGFTLGTKRRWENNIKRAPK